MGSIFCIAAFVLLSFSENNVQPDRVTLMHDQEIFVSGINVAWHRFSCDVGDQPVD